ncbi:hypothetical protein [Clostridium sp. MD294]|uniref:hypothetical protein n=1 Tax=Clostridium sp. MD294 TaxID=97138 RepID=UPI0002C8ACB9|nr:hypothetical protein [Clostridium sp. MD294]NDO47740.1 hypothetical protein [Clostridium sp. MD294]USF29942.1 hypothetical protein C820_001362 [Clostridium sp. MD294]
MTSNKESIIHQDTHVDEETMEKVRQLWSVAQSIQNIKINLYQEEFNEVEHTPEEAQISYEKINTIPIVNRVDVNA